MGRSADDSFEEYPQVGKAFDGDDWLYTYVDEKEGVIEFGDFQSLDQAEKTIADLARSFDLEWPLRAKAVHPPIKGRDAEKQKRRIAYEYRERTGSGLRVFFKPISEGEKNVRRAAAWLRACRIYVENGVPLDAILEAIWFGRFLEATEGKSKSLKKHRYADKKREREKGQFSQEEWDELLGKAKRSWHRHNHKDEPTTKQLKKFLPDEITKVPKSFPNIVSRWRGARDGY